MRDQYFGSREVAGLLEVLLVQSLPLPLLAIAYTIGAPGWLVAVNLGLSLTRIGVLIGTARAYERRSWTYWFSPLLDFPGKGNDHVVIISLSIDCDAAEFAVLDRHFSLHPRALGRHASKNYCRNPLRQ